MIAFSLNRPVVICIGMILLSLFGILGFLAMPYQLTPKVVRPIISVQTTWGGASPYEIEKEIIQPQEQALKGLENLNSMSSSIRNGRASIGLEFAIGTNSQQALLEVSNKLNAIKGYPSGIDRPVIRATGEDVSPVIYLMLTTSDKTKNIRHYRNFFNQKAIQYLERVPGVAEVLFFGGDEKQIHIILDHQKLALFDLSTHEIIDALVQENTNLSAGILDFGRKSYRIRSVSEFNSLEDMARAIIWSDGQKRIALSDIASIKEGFSNKTTSTLYNAKDALLVLIKPTEDANILELTNQVEQVFLDLNANLLKQENLELEWMSDQRGYILQAINLVKTNIFIGAILACGVLFLFLRSILSTLIIAITIPLSILGAFLVMALLGRTLNVVSLAGISFAVGMLIDCAIIVLENIHRHKAHKPLLEAISDGTREVVGGLVASVLTTIVIFLPIFIIQEESGQLFEDMAIAICAALLFSLLLSIITIPMLSHQLGQVRTKPLALFFLPLLESFGKAFVQRLMNLLAHAMRNTKTKLFTILLLSGSSLFISFWLFPKMDYLPQGNQNLIRVILNPPPGLSYAYKEAIGQQLFACLAPYLDHQKKPFIENMFYLGGESMYFNLRASNQNEPKALIPIARECVGKLPGIRGIVLQPGIFERSARKGRNIEISIQGNHLQSMANTTLKLQNLIKKEFGPSIQMRTRPSLEFLYPEINLYPDSNQLKALGLNAKNFGIALDVLIDGRKIGQYQQDFDRLDIIVKASNITSPEELLTANIYAPNGGIVSIASLAKQKIEYGLNEILHTERNRTFSLEVIPPLHLPIQQAMEQIQTILTNAKPLFSEQIQLSGLASGLQKVQSSLLGGFLFAVLLVYLLVAALYEDFVYPLIILFSVPLALGGGIIGLWLLNCFVHQPLDILSALGFLILVGIVVNNAILIVHQALYNIRIYKMQPNLAIFEATQSRIKPIYMSTLTSLFGMLPLVLSPGAGSEIYQALGAIILGGLSFSAFFTLFLIPALLSFVIKKEVRCKL